MRSICAIPGRRGSDRDRFEPGTSILNNPSGKTPKFDTTLWNMGGSVGARFVVPPQPAPWWAMPMNSQAARVELARQIIARCAIARIVETGTFLGTTTEFFAQFGLPVVTVEVNPEFAKHCSERLRDRKNVDLRVADSPEVLRDLAREKIDRGVPTLFYLDAHWQENLPLREEAELAITNFAKAVLLIDDFAVPDDPGYFFDDYGPGKRLDLDYLMKGKLPTLSIYFPSTPSNRETGARRGCVVVTADAALAAIFDDMPLLRRWKD